ELCAGDSLPLRTAPQSPARCAIRINFDTILLQFLHRRRNAMRLAVLTVILCLLSFVAPPPRSSAVADPADTVFVNGNVYTVNERNPRAESIGVKNGKIVFVGSNTDAKQYSGPNTRVVDLRGATIVPGMTDSHYHLTGVGER